MATPTDRMKESVSVAELARRWALVRDHMRATGLDALVVGGSAGPAAGYFRWFTGQPSPGGNPRTVLFPLEGLMTVVEHGPLGGDVALDGEDPAYRGIGRRLTTPSHLFSTAYTGGQDAALIAAALRHADHRSVGVVGPVGMYHGFCAPLKDALADRTVVDATDAIDHIKAPKSPEEQIEIRRTAAMQDRIIAAVAKHIRPGLRDFEVTAYAEYIGHCAGSDEGLFLGASAPIGRASVMAPRSLQGRTLARGDVMTLLVENNGPQGLYTEIARVFVLGRASSQLREGIEIVKEARANILSRLTPGTPASDIWNAHNAFMRARGLPEERRLNCHNQGYDLVERPLMRLDETMSIERGLNIACHPGFGNERFFAVLCDNYLVNDAGRPERIHGTPETLIELD